MQNEKQAFICPPCDQSCDTIIFQEAGICPHCKMKLVPKDQAVTKDAEKLNAIEMEDGAGAFLIDGGPMNQDKSIKVHYYKPGTFTENARVLLVIPGAGRNGDSYRDDWIDLAEKYSVLILSPSYPKAFYTFEDYHLGGLIQQSNFIEIVDYVEGTNQVKIDEDKIDYKVNLNSESWIFNDFDRIFDLVVNQLNLTQSTYDIFGHSAGGQILHRLVLLHNSEKVDQIIAANSGFYTLPSEDFRYPFGIQNEKKLQQDLKQVFNQKLCILVGELDNEKERRGTLLRSRSADVQGKHRLARAKFFYNYAKDLALKNKIHYNWNLEIVPMVGHDHTKMAAFAGHLLYED